MLTSQVYVTAVDSTGAEPDFFIYTEGGRHRSSNYSIELISYTKLVTENQRWMILDSSMIFHRIDILTILIESGYLASKLQQMPFAIDESKARWCPDLSLTSQEPLGSIRGRVIEIGDTFFHRIQQPRPMVISVFITNVIFLPPTLFAGCASLIRDDDDNGSFVSSIINAATEAAARNAAAPRHQPPTCGVCSDKIISPYPFLPCGHKFHRECIHELRMNINSRGCPLCYPML